MNRNDWGNTLAPAGKAGDCKLYPREETENNRNKHQEVTMYKRG